MHIGNTKARQLFTALVARSWLIIALSILSIGVGISFLPKIVKDTTADAFIDPESPALVERHRVEAMFGLKDPIVVAVIDDDEDGIFDADNLALVEWLSNEISRLDQVDPERVVSLASEKMIVGTDDGILVERFLEEEGDYFTAPLHSSLRAQQIRNAVQDFPLYLGSLVGRDGTGTIIVAELIDQSDAQQAYHAILDLVERAPVPDGTEVHVAGEGAVSGYLSTYIDQDARRLNPLAGLVITIILGIAFLTVRGALLPNFVVLGTVTGTMGIMAASGVHFYVITNGLIVNLIGMAVADSIHIFSQYFEERRASPGAERREIVARAMATMWRPVTLTTVTTMAGFIALAVSSVMPPIQFFGLFGALGVFIAWVYSMTLLPALMSVWPSKRIPRPFRADAQAMGGRPAQLMTAFGARVLARPGLALTIAIIVMVAGVFGASKIVTNDARIENFKPDEPLYLADKAINRVMDGTYYLDILIEADAPQALYKPENLRRMEALQDYLVSLPHVNGATSIVDYVKQLHKAVNENRADAYIIPDDEQLIAQLFFLYNASADPTDFEEEVDTLYQRALIRANVDVGSYLNNKQLIPAVESYIASEFNTAGLSAKVTGRVNVDYHWIDGIAQSNGYSVALSFAAVLLVAVAVFRSFIGGVIAVLPVAMAVLLVYAVMGFSGIWLGIGTSMFAAIAIGLSIDFAIHTLDRIREIAVREGINRQSLLKLYPSTGRALFFNFLAVALGFGVLTTSDVPPLVKFGTLVAVAVTSAFIASMTLIPALVQLLNPRFLTRRAGGGAKPLAATAASIAALVFIVLAPWNDAKAEDLSGLDIMTKVHARPDGAQVTRDLTLELTDSKGVVRVEKTTGYRKYFGDEKRTILFYTDPTHVRGTGFLTFDYADAGKDDDQWLYLPALRKVRRISAADRGDYFLGTDFTYEEIKKEQKVELSDYGFTFKGEEVVDGHTLLIVEGVPTSDKTAKELGYSRVIWRIDPEIWMSRLSDYYDRNGNHLKTITLEKVEKIDGIDTALQTFVQNHKTGHSTRLIFENVDYRSDVSDSLFSQARLRRGL